MHKQFDPGGRGLDRWFVSSQSSVGAFRLVTLEGPLGGLQSYWLCSCPKGRNGFEHMAWRDGERPCVHVQSVLVAEAEQGYTPRPTARPLVSGWVD